jgi:hypothetical protein
MKIEAVLAMFALVATNISPVYGQTGSQEPVVAGNSMQREKLPAEGTSVSEDQALVQSSAQAFPINALLYTNAPGNKACRGGVIMNIDLSMPSTTPTCYNTPSLAMCGTFAGNEDDGCQARVFASSNCETFMNLVVFTSDPKPQGGMIRSLEISCGIKGVVPPPLSLPGIQLPVQGGGTQSNSGGVKINQ